MYTTCVFSRQLHMNKSVSWIKTCNSIKSTAFHQLKALTSLYVTLKVRCILPENVFAIFFEGIVSDIIWPETWPVRFRITMSSHLNLDFAWYFLPSAIYSSIFCHSVKKKVKSVDPDVRSAGYKLILHVDWFNFNSDCFEIFVEKICSSFFLCFSVMLNTAHRCYRVF